MGILNKLIETNYRNNILEQEYNKWMQQMEEHKNAIAAQAGIDPTGKTMADIYKEVGEYNRLFKDEEKRKLEELHNAQGVISNVMSDNKITGTEWNKINSTPGAYNLMPSDVKMGVAQRVNRASFDSQGKFIQELDPTKLKEGEHSSGYTAAGRRYSDIDRATDSFIDYIYKNGGFRVRSSNEYYKLWNDFKDTDTGKKVITNNVKLPSVLDRGKQFFGTSSALSRTIGDNVNDSILTIAQTLKGAGKTEITANDVYNSWEHQNPKATPTERQYALSSAKKVVKDVNNTPLKDIISPATASVGTARKVYGNTQTAIDDGKSFFSYNGEVSSSELANRFETNGIDEIINASDNNLNVNLFTHNPSKALYGEMNYEVSIPSLDGDNVSSNVNLPTAIKTIFGNKYKDLTQLGLSILSRDGIGTEKSLANKMKASSSDPAVDYVAGTLIEMRKAALKKNKESAKSLYNQSLIWGSSYQSKSVNGSAVSDTSKVQQTPPKGDGFNNKALFNSKQNKSYNEIEDEFYNDNYDDYFNPAPKRDVGDELGKIFNKLYVS